MIALLALLFSLHLAPAEPARLEAALVVPTADSLRLDGETVLHDAARGVTIVSDLQPGTIDALTDGSLARFVVAGVARFDGEPARIRLPLGAGELTYIGLRNGRPQALNVVNPAAVTVIAEAVPNGDGAQLQLTFEVIQLQAQAEVEALDNAPVGEPVFSNRAVALKQKLADGQTALILIASDAEVEVGGRNLEVTFRRRVGNQVVEAPSPLLGILLRLVPAGGKLAFDTLEPPVAPPGSIRIGGAVERPGVLAWQPETQASSVLSQAGAAEDRSLKVNRLEPSGRVQQFERARVPQPGEAGDFVVQDRDLLLVQPDDAMATKSAPRAPAGERGPAGPAGPATRPAPAAAQQQNYPQQTALPGPVRSMPLDELRQAAPAAAAAAASVVALRGQINDGNGRREILLGGTIVGADGLILTAPASSLAEVEDLRAVLRDGQELTCERLGTDRTGALLALKVDAANLPALRPKLMLPPPGTPVLVVGHPYGLVHSVTLTIVGGPARDLPGAPGAALQLDGALAQGNSGGPIVDLDGKLVGLAYGTIRAQEPGPEVSLAVDGATIAAFLDQLRE